MALVKFMASGCVKVRGIAIGGEGGRLGEMRSVKRKRSGVMIGMMMHMIHGAKPTGRDGGKRRIPYQNVIVQRRIVGDSEYYFRGEMEMNQ